MREGLACACTRFVVYIGGFAKGHCAARRPRLRRRTKEGSKVVHTTRTQTGPREMALVGLLLPLGENGRKR